MNPREIQGVRKTSLMLIARQFFTFLT